MATTECDYTHCLCFQSRRLISVLAFEPAESC